jgi:predicted helicase
MNNYNRNLKDKFTDNKIIFSMFRPFIKKFYYSSEILSDSLFSKHLDCLSIENTYIAFSGKGHNHGFSLFASKYIPNLDCIEKGQCIPMFILNKSKKETANITDWALKEFISNYQDATITKEKIFHYVYAVLHDPGYKVKYRNDLSRNAPHIPFYKDFRQWSAWGKMLMNLHTNYENAEDYPVNIKLTKGGTIQKQFKCDKISGQIIIDDTTISGIPLEVFGYKLSQRSALEWIIDQYKPRKIDDLTISERFNTHDYSQYKDEIITLIKKVITVSLETLKILELMKGNCEE